MSQQKFANYFGIPVGTLRNWEQGIAKPPVYVFTMIFQRIRRDSMINLKTMKFMKKLDWLAELSKNGIEEFSNATEKTYQQKLFYCKDFDNKLVLDACIWDDEECYHHDIISFFEDTEYVAKIRFDEENNKPFVEITLGDYEDQIIIEDGSWYFV